MKNEPKRHHYIPQFILRNFCVDDKGTVYYYDKIRCRTSVQKIQNIFMSMHLYRDEVNSPDDPTKLERDLSVFESEVSHIIKNKFLCEKEITLNMHEDAKLRLFFAIMGFRAERVKETFKNQKSTSLYAPYQQDCNFEDLWKRNLSKIVNCRSIYEVIEHPEIDAPVKVFFHRDTLNISGLYFVVVERDNCEEFILCDTYPVVITGVLNNGLPLHIYSIFPISPDRAILMVSNGAVLSPRNVTFFRPLVFTEPKMNNDGTYTIRVKKIYSEEVKHINEYLAKEAKLGFISRSCEK